MKKSAEAIPLRRRTPEWVEQESHFASRVLIFAAIAGLLFAGIFAALPRLDIQIAGLVFDGDDFWLQGSDFWWWLRRLMMTGYGIFYAVIIVGVFSAWLKRTVVWTLYPLEWLYLVLCSLLGPLLLTNVILKDNIGRPRPRSVTEFGGGLEYKNVFMPGGGCDGNCSFVSGEVSSMVMIFASLMFIMPGCRKLWLFILFPAWGFSAFLRIGEGAHFASDTLLAGTFMIAVAASLYWLMFLRGAGGARE